MGRSPVRQLALLSFGLVASIVLVNNYPWLVLVLAPLPLLVAVAGYLQDDYITKVINISILCFIYAGLTGWFGLAAGFGTLAVLWALLLQRLAGNWQFGLWPLGLILISGSIFWLQAGVSLLLIISLSAQWVVIMIIMMILARQSQNVSSH